MVNELSISFTGESSTKKQNETWCVLEIRRHDICSLMYMEVCSTKYLACDV